jgi:cation diffusion facilitator family transporter
MHSLNPENWRHSHDFVPLSHERGERQTRIVIALTAAMMVIEIAAGSVFNSMALLADGWHMASHASALSITAFAYFYARRHASSARYSFGTWKVSVLGGYSSAVVLAIIAALIAWESVGRFFEPMDISFDEAILVAVVGLLVNLLSVYLLREEPHEHGHSHGGDHHHHDHNRRAAYLHVLADTLTSGTAIFALLTGKFFGWVWMDPLMGVVGSIVIARWSYSLLRDTSGILLDGSVPAETIDAIREALQGGASGDVVADLHVWPLGPGKLAVIASIVTDHPRGPDDYKELLAHRPELVHVTVEVNRCPGHDVVAA